MCQNSVENLGYIDERHLLVGSIEYSLGLTTSFANDFKHAFIISASCLPEDMICAIDLNFDMHNF